MKILLFTLISTFSCIGQNQVTINEIRPDHIKSVFDITWVISKDYIIGETFTIGKRSKFQYEILTCEPIKSGMFTKTEIVNGKYRMKGDTIFLITKIAPKSYGPEFLHFKLSYVVKALKIMTEKFEPDKNYFYQLLCLVPYSKLDSWNKYLEEISTTLNELEIEDRGVPWNGLYNLKTQAEIKFWEKGIFVTSDIKKFGSK